MSQIIPDNPMVAVILVGGIVAIGCTAIVVITDYLRKTHQAEIDASLKHAMLERGMSAADIKTVLEATGDQEQIRQAKSNDGVRLECGDFQLELGNLSKRPGERAEHQPL